MSAHSSSCIDGNAAVVQRNQTNANISWTAGVEQAADLCGIRLSLCLRPFCLAACVGSSRSREEWNPLNVSLRLNLADVQIN